MNTSCSGGSRKNRKGIKRRGGAGCGGNNTMIGGNFYGAAVDPSLGTGNMARPAVPNLSANSATGQLGPADTGAMNGGRRKTKRMTMKNIKKMLKKNGLKTTGRKSVLLRRMKKAKIMKGGADYLPLKAGVLGFTGEGAVRGMGGFEDVGGQRSNDVTPLK